MYRLSQVAPALTAATIIGLVGATAAPAAVSPPTWVSGIELDAAEFAVAMNPSGDRSALAYAGPVSRSRAGRTMLFAQLGHGRRFSSSQRLEDLRRGAGLRAQVRLSAVKVSVAGDGSAVAVWVVMTATRRFEHFRYRLRVARAPTGKRFERPRTALSATRPFELTGLVAGRDGLAVVGLRRDERMQVVVARQGAAIAAPQDLGPSTVYAAPPSLAVAPGGSVLAAWSPTSASTAQAALLAPRGRRFGAARAVSAAGEAASYAGAVAGPGGVGVAWTTYSVKDIPWPVGGHVRFARLNSSAGDFAAPVTLADVTISGAAQVALPRGGATTTWRQYIDKTVPGDSDFFINSQLFAHAPLTGDTASRALSQLPAIAFRPVIGALGDRALIAWREAPVSTIGSRLRLAVAGPHGWEPTVTFANGGRDIQTTPETGIAEDERPAAGELTIATGVSSALLAWTAVARQANGDTLHRVRLASYRP
jgi:hypothetical protein